MFFKFAGDLLHLVREYKVVTLAAGLAVTVPVFVWLVRSRKADPVPEIPLACPDQMHWFLGHAPLMQDMLNGLHKICVEESKVDGLSKFKLVGLTAVSVLKAEHVKAVLNASNYRQRIPLLAKHMDMFLGRRALVQLMKDEWKVMRKIMARAFNWEFLKETVVDIGEVTNVFIKALSAKNGQVCDFWPLMKCITLDVIGKSSFGYDFSCSATLKSSPVAVAFEWMLEDSMIRQFKKTMDPRCWFYSYPSDANKKHAECAAIIRQTLADIISTRTAMRSDKGGPQHKDILKYMLDAHEEEKVAADTDTLVDNLITILFGGFDTSSITLTYALYMLTQHRDVEQRVVDEVASVLGKDGQPTYDILMNQLPYCTAVINEVLRLYPPAPVTVRTLEEPLDLQVCTGRGGPAGDAGGAERTVTIPAGTMMYIPIWWIHRSPHNFPDNPDEFDPDRFYSPERAAKIHRFAHVAFSGGPRD
eukprot:CAMPEP_0172161122 /NCGR_PEP_ID=MMETSP1050-20130122/5947_1 /TAXON_ID=233186 /ORGANISM="Cryptomonas curvata, Strain CCAP979/52" /LENGTH=473 /DNA_ID=CAMNT_0012830979 /DNA_START=146 /DNA_END=1564 /DNA_ORIENTATION=+